MTLSYKAKNNAKSSVADNPLSSVATTLNVATGEGSEFPADVDCPFMATIWNATTYPDPGDDPNMEIVEVTGRTADDSQMTKQFHMRIDSQQLYRRDDLGRFQWKYMDLKKCKNGLGDYVNEFNTKPSRKIT